MRLSRATVQPLLTSETIFNVTTAPPRVRDWFKADKASHREFVRTAWEAALPGGGHSDHEARWERFAGIAYATIPALLAEVDALQAALRAYGATWHTANGHEGHIDACHWTTCTALRLFGAPVVEVQEGPRP